MEFVDRFMPLSLDRRKVLEYTTRDYNSTIINNEKDGILEFEYSLCVSLAATLAVFIASVFALIWAFWTDVTVIRNQIYLFEK